MLGYSVGKGISCEEASVGEGVPVGKCARYITVVSRYQMCCGTSCAKILTG